jgi:hypothetical protein
MLSRVVTPRFLRNLATNLHRTPCIALTSSQCCRGYAFKVGDSATLSKTFTSEEVKLYSEISLDTNPVHLNAEYAATTRFKKPICHGLLTVS